MINFTNNYPKQKQEMSLTVLKKIMIRLAAKNVTLDCGWIRIIVKNNTYNKKTSHASRSRNKKIVTIPQQTIL